MIVSPNKGIFFVATALMCSVSLYAAELTSPRNDPLTRLFVGEPNRLSVPPGFPATAEVTLEEQSCAAQVPELALADAARHNTASVSPDGAECRSEDKPEPSTIPVPTTLGAVSTGGQASAPATSVGTAAQAH